MRRLPYLEEPLLLRTTDRLGQIEGRLAGDADHRTVMPCSALAGGALLVVSDTLARTVIAPRQLPVGAITAMIGVPLFLVLLRRMNSKPDQAGAERANN